MIEQVPPCLIVALGNTGLRAGKLLHDSRCRSSGKLLQLAGFGFDPPPDGFPTANFVPLTIDPNAALDNLSQEYDLLPRPLERLAWFEALSGGEQSALFRLLRSQLPHTKQTVLVFVLADLGEACGSSLLVDAAVFIRVLANRYNQNIAVLAYTVIPGSDASHEEQLRAYVALRELAYFATSADQTAFQYSQTSTNELGQTSLTTPRFDAWYCVERTAETPELLAEVVNVYLGQRANEIKQQRMVNISGRIAHISHTMPIVGTVNVQSLVLPVEQLQRYWALDLVRSIIHQMATGEVDAQYVLRQRQLFWTSFPVDSLESMLFNRRLRINRHIETRPLDERTAELDRLIFSSKSVAPLAFTESSLNLRSNRFLIESPYNHQSPKREQIIELLDRVETLAHYFGSYDDPTSSSTSENAYLSLVNGAVQGHLQRFRDTLHYLLKVILKNSTVKTTQIFLAEILNEIDDARGVFADLQLAQSATQPDFAYLQQHKRCFRELTQQIPFVLDKIARQQLFDFQQASALYFDTIRLNILIEQSSQLLDLMVADVQQLHDELASWQQVIAHAQAEMELQAEQAKVFPPTAKRFVVLESPDQLWAKQQQERYLTRIGGLQSVAERLKWKVTYGSAKLQVQLHWDDVSLRPDTLQSTLITAAQAIFADAANELSILKFLNALASDKPISDLVKQLRLAEQSPLHLVKHNGTSSGILLTPLEEHPHDRRTLRMLESRLKSAHNVALTDNELIYRERHNDPYRITYLFVTEFINLFTDTRVYAHLEALARDHQKQIDVQSIFRLSTEIEI